MPTEIRLYVDNEPLDAAKLDALGDIRVELGIGMAAEAEVEVPVSADEHGVWAQLEEDWVQPFTRVRVEVKVGDGEFVPIIDGPIVGQRIELSAATDESRVRLVVQDDSVLLNRDEKVTLFEDMSDDEIARNVISDAGLTAEVDDTPDAGSALTRAVVQRGTDMQLLRELARRHGMFVYVKPGDQPGESVGVFARPNLERGDLPEILLLGADRNVSSFNAELDALKPMTVTAGSITIADREVQSSEATTSSLDPLTGDALHDVLDPLTATRLVRTREELSDLDEATAAAVDASSWAYTATAEVDAETYEGVLLPYTVVRVAGAGGHLSGDYLVSHVTHLITQDGYRQRFGLRRNARSTGTDADAGGVPGGII